MHSAPNTWSGHPNIIVPENIPSDKEIEDGNPNKPSLMDLVVTIVLENETNAICTPQGIALLTPKGRFTRLVKKVLEHIIIETGIANKPETRDYMAMYSLFMIMKHHGFLDHYGIENWMIAANTVGLDSRFYERSDIILGRLDNHKIQTISQQTMLKTQISLT